MKKHLIAILTILSLSIFLGACNSPYQTDNSTSTNANNINNDNGKLTAIATLFPQYDFARIVGGDKIEVVKLLPNGVESHSYEPAPSDIIKINEADFFVYTGYNMEPWASTIIDGTTGQDLKVVDVSQNVPLINTEDNGHQEIQDHHDHYAADPHIWTDPTRAMIMVDNIAAAFAAKDPDNAQYYQANAESYKQELEALDTEIQNIVDTGVRQKIIFGGRFAFAYLCDRYNLDHDAAYDSCSESGEPSARKVAQLMDEITQEGLPVIYYEELRKPTVAQSIADDTGAETLLLHSCHNVTEAELAEGVTYLSLMKANAENLRKGLN